MTPDIRPDVPRTVIHCPGDLKAWLIEEGKTEGKRLLGRPMPLGTFIIKVLSDYRRSRNE